MMLLANTNTYFPGQFINFSAILYDFYGPTICLSVFDGMATLLHEKLVASCVEPKVFGGTRISGQLNHVNHQLHDLAPKVFTFNFMAGSLILNAPISTITKKVRWPKSL
ncbi:hypothetical protein YC2023_061722 [Brassica napus]